MATVHMYPITPTELHEGWVKGEERIITTLPGVYGWHGDTQLHRVYRYDGRGLEIGHGWYSTVRESGVSTRVDPGPNEIAIIERVPMTVDGAAPANVLIRQYDGDAIRLDLRTQGEVRLSIRDGAFPLAAGEKYTIISGDRTREGVPGGGMLTLHDSGRPEPITRYAVPIRRPCVSTARAKDPATGPIWGAAGEPVEQAFPKTTRPCKGSNWPKGFVKPRGFGYIVGLRSRACVTRGRVSCTRAIQIRLLWGRLQAARNHRSRVDILSGSHDRGLVTD